MAESLLGFLVELAGGVAVAAGVTVVVGVAVLSGEPDVNLDGAWPGLLLVSCGAVEARGFADFRGPITCRKLVAARMRGREDVDGWLRSSR